MAPEPPALDGGVVDEDGVDPEPADLEVEPCAPFVPEEGADDEEEDDSDFELEDELGLEEGVGAEGLGVDDGDEGGVGIWGEEGDWVAQAARSNRTGARPAARAGPRPWTDAMFMLSCLDRSWRRDLDVRE